MVEERGSIVKLDATQAQVEFVRQAACGNCGAKSACGTGALGAFLGRRRHRVWLENSVGGALGDRVVVGIGEADFVSTSVMAYLLPLLTLFVGAVVADSLWQPGNGSEVPAVLGASAGLGLGLFGLRRWMGAKGRARNLQILRKEPKTAEVVRFS